MTQNDYITLTYCSGMFLSFIINLFIELDSRDQPNYLLISSYIIFWPLWFVVILVKIIITTIVEVIYSFFK